MEPNPPTPPTDPNQATTAASPSTQVSTAGQSAAPAQTRTTLEIARLIPRFLSNVVELFETTSTSLFENTKNVTEEEKSKFRDVVRKHAQQRTKGIIHYGKQLMLSGVTYLSFVLICSWLVPRSIVNLLSPQTGMSGRPWVPLVGLCFSGLTLFAVPALVNWFFIKSLDRKLWTGWYIFVACTSAYAAYRVGVTGAATFPLSSFELALVLATPSWLSIALGGFTALVGHLSERMDAKMSEDSPQGMLVLRLIDILDEAENFAQWQRIEGRWSIVHSLEGAARDLERALRKASGDQRTDQWLKKSILYTTTALRNLKRRVLFPRLNTREEFIRQISRTLIFALEGQWGEIARTRPAKLAKPTWSDTALRIIRLLVSALAPAVVMFFIQSNPLLVQVPGMGYLMIACVVWIALTIITAIDPNFSARLGTAREVKDILSRITNPSKD